MANRVQCRNCGDILESNHQHDWVSCSCYRNDEDTDGIYIDGGEEYCRYGGNIYNMIWLDRSPNEITNYDKLAEKDVLDREIKLKGNYTIEEDYPDGVWSNENNKTELYNNGYTMMYPGFHPEFLDFLKVIEFGAQKYALNNWLQEDGACSDHKSMHSSLMRHVALSYANERLDKESGLDHLLHIMCRAAMMYTRLKRNVVHPIDKDKKDEAKS